MIRIDDELWLRASHIGAVIIRDGVSSIERKEEDAHDRSITKEDAERIVKEVNEAEEKRLKRLMEVVYPWEDAPRDGAENGGIICPNGPSPE